MMRQEQDWRDDLRAARYLGVAPWELADHPDWRERALMALRGEEAVPGQSEPHLLTRVCQTADRLLDCLNEFAPEYPQACSDYCQELDTALAAVEAAGYCQQRGSP